jgi:hypothetical protein
MDPQHADTTEQVRKSVNLHQSKKAASDATMMEESGQAIVEKIRQAAALSNENCDRALDLAHKLSIQLRAAEDRIYQLEAEVKQLQDRAARAEKWLQLIEKEIEEKLIAPRLGSRTELTTLQ